VTDLDAFVKLSAALTGFDRVELLGTGQAPAYFDWVTRHTDLLTLQALWPIARGPLTEADLQTLLAHAPLGAIARQINFLWYTGQWKDPFMPGFAAPTTVISPAAYEAALVWRAAAAHPMGAQQMGFGSWSTPLAKDADR